MKLPMKKGMKGMESMKEGPKSKSGKKGTYPMKGKPVKVVKKK